RGVAGASARRGPLARLHFRLGGNPGAFSRRVLDARHRRQAHLGLDRAGPRLDRLFDTAVPGTLAARLPARGSARGRGRGALARRARTPAQGRGDRRERGLHRGVRRALGAVHRLRRSALRLLGDLSVRFALAAIIGGLGTALGPFLGSVLVTTVETWLRAE